MTETQRKAYIIADNRLALNAGWDNELLTIELGELRDLGFDLDLTGFSDNEIALIGSPDFEPGTEDDQGKLDELGPKWIACPKCGSEFDARKV
jgi:ParB-like chromosome segregation protein Spo0J